ncbi:hypothetical protein [Neoroseomonas rubea]|uniref:hypothetical protein n=1 Tax=Neoroseomonas rubea TaxID=2748666 RepID=UPI0018E00C5E|nr:hypothetical protein [Roseomonas rubea]
MPRAAFPLSKSGNKTYRLGNRRWRIVTFDASGASFRLLINYSAPLGQYQAILGLTDGGDTRVVASFEKHPDHKGWHVHATCGPLSDVPAGIHRGPWVRNLNRAQRASQPDPATMSDEAAFAVARRFFRLDNVPPFGLVP